MKQRGGDLLAAAPDLDCACRKRNWLLIFNKNRFYIPPAEDPSFDSDKKGGAAATKAPGEDNGRCRVAVDASLLPVGVLFCLFSLFAVFEPALPASLPPPGGDLVLMPLVDKFPLLSTLSCCEYALAGLSHCPGVLDPALSSLRPAVFEIRPPLIFEDLRIEEAWLALPGEEVAGGSL